MFWWRHRRRPVNRDADQSLADITARFTTQPGLLSPASFSLKAARKYSENRSQQRLQITCRCRDSTTRRASPTPPGALMLANMLSAVYQMVLWMLLNNTHQDRVCLERCSESQKAYFQLHQDSDGRTASWFSRTNTMKTLTRPLRLAD